MVHFGNITDKILNLDNLKIVQELIIIVNKSFFYNN